MTKLAIGNAVAQHLSQIALAVGFIDHIHLVNNRNVLDLAQNHIYQDDIVLDSQRWGLIHLVYIDQLNNQNLFDLAHYEPIQANLQYQVADQQWLAEKSFVAFGRNNLGNGHIVCEIVPTHLVWGQHQLDWAGMAGRSNPLLSFQTVGYFAPGAGHVPAANAQLLCQYLLQSLLNRPQPVQDMGAVNCIDFVNFLGNNDAITTNSPKWGLIHRTATGIHLPNAIDVAILGQGPHLAVPAPANKAWLLSKSFVAFGRHNNAGALEIHVVPVHAVCGLYAQHGHAGQQPILDWNHIAYARNDYLSP